MAAVKAAQYQALAVRCHSSIVRTSDCPRALQSRYWAVTWSWFAIKSSTASLAGAGSGGHGVRWLACSPGGGGGGGAFGVGALIALLPVLQDISAKAQAAQVRARGSQCSQGLLLLGGKLSVGFTVSLQIGGNGIDALGGLLVRQRAIHRVLPQLLGGGGEVGDGLAVGVALGFQVFGLGDGGLALAPGIPAPDAEDQRKQRRGDGDSPAEHQHTASPGQPAAR